ncbi:MAG: right-handed parallel beta-helix repeat-containing protein [Candidatus Asgardarchaeum sp.]
MLYSASGSVNIFNNTFINCLFALTLDYLQNAIIARNTLINSIACGITATGYNVTIKDNYIYNERDLLQTEVDLFGDISKGIDI